MVILRFSIVNFGDSNSFFDQEWFLNFYKFSNMVEVPQDPGSQDRTFLRLWFEEVRASKMIIIKEAQKEIELELKEAADSGKGRFRKLAPVKDQEGVWRVGSRLRNYVPFTEDSEMPKILPTNHRTTLLLMRSAHQFSHSGQDGTLARFHADGFWTVRAGHVARKVKNSCVPCRKVAKITLH